MFPQRHPFGTGLTYGLNYPTPNHKQGRMMRNIQVRRIWGQIHFMKEGMIEDYFLNFKWCKF